MIKLLSKNIIIYGGTNALKSLVPLLMLPILTQYLTANELGTLSLVETTILFVAPFILLNINAAINVEYFKISHQELSSYITNALSLSLISFIIIFSIFLLVKSYLASILNIASSFILWIVIFSALRVVISVILGLYQVKEESLNFAKYTLLQTIVDFTLSYVFIVFAKLGLVGRLEGIYLSYFLFSLLGLFLLYNMGYLTTITFKYTKNILNFGVPLIPHAISGTIIAMSDRYFISYFIGNDKVGLYTIAYQLSALMLLVSVSVNQAWSPMLFKLLKEKKVQQVYKFTFYLFLLFVSVGVSVYFLRDILFYIFVNENFYKAKEYFGSLLIGFVFQSLYFLVTNVLFFEKRTKLLASITFIGAILNVLLNYYLIQFYGTIGVAYATAITWAIFFFAILFINIQLLKRMNIK